MGEGMVYGGLHFPDNLDTGCRVFDFCCIDGAWLDWYTKLLNVLYKDLQIND